MGDMEKEAPMTYEEARKRAIKENSTQPHFHARHICFDAGFDFAIELLKSQEAMALNALHMVENGIGARPYHYATWLSEQKSKGSPREG